MSWLDELRQDARFGVRTLLKNPGFTTAAVLTLALATGATTAIFTVVNAVLLRPLPFAAPERLVQIAPVNSIVSRAALEEFRRSASAQEITEYALTTRHLAVSGDAERLSVVMTDREFFSVLGAQPLVGRTFGPDDPPRAVVLGAAFWRRRFKGDPHVVGQTIAIDDESFTVLGVMPQRFQFPYGAASVLNGAQQEARTDMWMAEYRPRRGRVDDLTGRLKPGATPAGASAELSGIVARASQAGQASRPSAMRVEPLEDAVLRPVRRSLWLLVGAVGLVLAAACTNVAGLFLALTTARMREVATRAALGATRARLVRQFLSESLVLSLIGGAVGGLIARWGTTALTRFLLTRVPRAHEIMIDWRVFAFLLIVCAITAAFFGLAPALAAAQVDPQSVTSETGSRATAGGRFSRIRDGLVVTEVALAFVLACGVATVVAEMNRLRTSDVGMDPTNAIAFHLGQRTTPSTDVHQYYDIADRVGELPGVAAAGFTQVLPLQNWGWWSNSADFTIRSRPGVELPPFQIEMRYVSPGYFKTLGIPLLKGRGFTAQDDRGAPPVVLINQTLARRYFGSEDPTGLMANRGTIIGVVGDVRQVKLGEPASPELYFPMVQNWSQVGDLGMTLVVRTDRNPEAIVDAVRSTVRRVNPGIAIFNIRTMEDVMLESLWELNLYRSLVGLFALLALALAAIGLYGVVSYSVTARAREFAIRLALGSDPAGLSGLVVRHGARLATAGVAIGAASSILLAKGLSNFPAAFVPGPITLVLISTALLVVSLAACVVPSLRVTRIAPAVGLRRD
jgi:putative ABC transport system permease protein